MNRLYTSYSFFKHNTLRQREKKWTCAHADVILGTQEKEKKKLAFLALFFCSPDLRSKRQEKPLGRGSGMLQMNEAVVDHTFSAASRRLFQQEHSPDSCVRLAVFFKKNRINDSSLGTENR